MNKKAVGLFWVAIAKIAWLHVRYMYCVHGRVVRTELMDAEWSCRRQQGLLPPRRVCE
jgi:hypothetical protein